MSEECPWNSTSTAPLWAKLDNRSAASFFENVNNGLLFAKANPKPSQTNKTELFTKIGYILEPCIVSPNIFILVIWCDFEYASDLKHSDKEYSA